MPNKIRRINVTFEKPTVDFLSNLAHKKHKSVARLVRELVLEALELREDYHLSMIAKKSDAPQNTNTYTHEDAWK